jgi:hypothetical protein
MLAYLQRCGEHLNFATYSPGDPDRHACAIDKDVLGVIHRRAVTELRRHEPDRPPGTVPDARDHAVPQSMTSRG